MCVSPMFYVSESRSQKPEKKPVIFLDVMINAVVDLARYAQQVRGFHNTVESFRSDLDHKAAALLKCIWDEDTSIEQLPTG